MVSLPLNKGLLRFGQFDQVGKVGSATVQAIEVGRNEKDESTDKQTIALLVCHPQFDGRLVAHI